MIVLCDLQDVSYADARKRLAVLLARFARAASGSPLLADKLQRGLACADATRRPTVRCEA